jgi:uncharacterized OB-fold protein
MTEQQKPYDVPHPSRQRHLPEHRSPVDDGSRHKEVPTEKCDNCGNEFPIMRAVCPTCGFPLDPHAG